MKKENWLRRNAFVTLDWFPNKLFYVVSVQSTFSSEEIALKSIRCVIKNLPIQYGEIHTMYLTVKRIKKDYLIATNTYHYDMPKLDKSTFIVRRAKESFVSLFKLTKRLE